MDLRLRPGREAVLSAGHSSDEHRGGSPLRAASGESDATGPQPSTTRSAGVLVASVCLVLAVWASLELAPGPVGDGASGAASDAGLPVPAPTAGFRADAWCLPDDSVLGFVEIPAGSFTMGSDPGVDRLAFDVEYWGAQRVQGHVDLPTFYMGRFEVTVAQFADFVRESGHRLADPQALRAPPDHPVTMVAWTDAVAYAQWLDGALHGAAEGSASGVPAALARLVSAGWHVALPTEAQWEKAARGVDGRIYPWGDSLRADRANFRARGTTAVGSFPCPECPYPLSDMAGNVWEWTASPYQPYPYTDADDRDGLAAPALWVMRGGSFGDPERFIRAANRGGADPGARRPFIGFRVALVRD